MFLFLLPSITITNFISDPGTVFCTSGAQPPPRGLPTGPEFWQWGSGSSINCHRSQSWHWAMVRSGTWDQDGNPDCTYRLTLRADPMLDPAQRPALLMESGLHATHLVYAPLFCTTAQFLVG